MENTTTKIDYMALLNMFISDDQLRPNICRPFKRNGKYYATDAHSLIWFSEEKMELDIPEYHDSVRVEAVIPAETNCNITINIADLEKKLVPDLIDEMIYVGQDIKCDECNGEGSVEWEFDSKGGRTYHKEHECPICDGSGFSEEQQKKPSGNKIPDPMKKFRMFGVGFMDRQIRRFVEACKMIGAETATRVYGTERGANVFRVGDFTILIMPFLITEYDKMEDVITDIMV